MAKYSSPGIYIEQTPKTIEATKLNISGLTGFIGVTEKGPLHKGIKLKSFKEFQDIFGKFTGFSNLAYSVFGFFNAGGKECLVVRTAHTNNQDSGAADSAAKASLELKSPVDKPVLQLTALTEGTWGNYIKVKAWHNVHTTAALKESVEKNHESVAIDPDELENFHRNDIICLRSKNCFEYKRIREIKDERLYLSSKIEKDFAGQELFCEKLLVSITLIKDKKVEEYLYTSVNPSDPNYFIDEINRRSNLVRAEKLEGCLPSETFYTTLNGGRNGILGLTPADFIGWFHGLEDKKGLGIFEGNDRVALLCAPDLMLFESLVHKDKKKAQEDIFAVQNAMVSQCEKLGSRFAILDAPTMKDNLDLLKWSGRFDSKHAALYYPGISILNPEDITGLTTIMIPPSGHIAGIYVNCDRTEGIYRAPANKFLQGAVGMARKIPREEYDILYERGINCMKYVPGRGVKIWGARTLSSDPEWRYINVRRTFCAIRDALKNGTGWAVFEPNDKKLRKRLVRHVSAFLLDLWRDGFMTGAVPEEGFYIRCDDELNPKENIDAGIITVEVGISIARPAEFLVIQLKANTEDSAVSFED